MAALVGPTFGDGTGVDCSDVTGVACCEFGFEPTQAGASLWWLRLRDDGAAATTAISWRLLMPVVPTVSRMLPSKLQCLRPNLQRHAQKARSPMPRHGTRIDSRPTNKTRSVCATTAKTRARMQPSQDTYTLHNVASAYLTQAAWHRIPATFAD